MSVIGRLDKQVEEVLIAPIARRHDREARERNDEKQAEKTKQATTEEEQQDDSQQAAR